MTEQHAAEGEYDDDGDGEEGFDFEGLTDPGGVGDSALALLRHIARDGSYLAVSHWVDCDDGTSRGIVELQADLT